MKKSTTTIWLMFLIVTFAAFLDAAKAFDYENPEKLSPGDCWVILSDGRKVIRSGRYCPRPAPSPEARPPESEPFWNNTAGRPFSGGYSDPEGGSAPSGESEGNANAGISATSESGGGYPLPYDRHHHGRHHRHPDPSGFRNGYPVNPDIPVLPADQRLFQEITKNLYPGVKPQTRKP